MNVGSTIPQLLESSLRGDCTAEGGRCSSEEAAAQTAEFHCLLAGGWGLHATQSNWGRLHTKLTLSLELVGMQS